MEETATERAAEQEVEEFAGWVFDRLLGGMELLSIYLGDRLGLYQALLEGPATVTELSARAGVHERYTREWLEQQAVAGILVVDGEGEAAVFRLPAAQAEVLTNPGSPRILGTAVAPVRLALLARCRRWSEAYRSGGGVPWARFGADARDGQGDVNRPWFEHALADALAAVPAVHDVLSRPDAGIADVACGHGWSTIALARAYPDAIVDGFDLDEPAIEAARQHAAGIDERDVLGTARRAVSRSRVRNGTTPGSSSRPCTTSPTRSGCSRRCVAPSGRTESSSSWTKPSPTRSARPATRSSARCTGTAS